MKEDKIEQLLKAIEHPETYSDEALERLFEDDEVRECYELYISSEQAAMSKESVYHKETVSLKGINSQFTVRKLMVAALITAAIILSGIAYATIISKKNYISEAEKPVTVATQKVAHKQSSAIVLPKDTTLTFQNTELNTILSTIASHYQMDVEYRNEHIRHIRLYTKWNTAEPLEQIVERLNGFEKVTITIDHDLLIVE